MSVTRGMKMAGRTGASAKDDRTSNDLCAGKMIVRTKRKGHLWLKPFGD